MTLDAFRAAANPPPNGASCVAAPASSRRKAPAAAARNPSGSVLALEGISLSFGGVAALSGIDLDVRPREIRALIGPNGAGKSSLVNVISGIYRPDAGRVWIDGQAFRQVPTPRVARLGLARTFQNLALFKGLSVFDNVVMGLTHRVSSSALEQVFGLPRARRETARGRAAVAAILDLLGLAASAGRPAGTLSYGLQKRVELARALVAEPKILLLDEPMAGVSALEKSEMAAFIRLARDRLGAAIILIEHDVGVVMGLSDRIAVLDYGRKIADGTPEHIRGNRLVVDAYLGVAHGDAPIHEAA